MWLDRPHLERRLKPDVRVMSVAAGPGYGKTVLAARLFAAWAGPKLWYGLDASDTDLAVFAAHLDAGLRACGVALPAFDASNATSLGSPREVGSRFAEALADMPQPPMLVFDDVHALEGGRALEALAEFVARASRFGASLILCGRSIPLPLHRIAASAQLVSFGAADLAFDADETRTYLSRAANGSTSELESFAARAEGWPAGLALIASSAPSRFDAAKHSALSAGDEEARRFLFDYLASEVLDSLSEREREFLLDTSILDRLEIEMCDALRGADDSRAMLESFARRGLFVSRASEDAFTYHQLFREFLRHNLAGSRSVEHVTGLRRRAADHFASRGDWARAIANRLDAGDVEDAAVELESHAFSLLRAGLVTAVGGFMQRMPPARIDGSATLLATLGRLQRERGEWDAALLSLDRAIGAARATRQFDMLAEAVRFCAPILASRGEFGRLRSMLGEALASSDDLPETSATSLRLTLASVDLETGRVDAALATYKEITPAVVARGDLAAQGLVLHNTAVALLRRGDVYAGLSMYERALKLKESAGQRISALNTLSDLIYVKILLGDVEEAESLVEALLAQAHDLGADAIVARGHEERGALKLAQGDVEGAAAAYRAAKAACDPGDVLLLPDIEHGLAQCALQLGDAAGADTLCARAIAILRGAGRSQQTGPVLITQAGCAMRRGDAREAAGLAREAIAAAADGPNTVLAATVCLEAAALLADCAPRLDQADAAPAEGAASDAAAAAMALIHQRDYRFLLRTKAGVLEQLRAHLSRWQVGSGVMTDGKAAAPAGMRIDMLGSLRVWLGGSPVAPESWKRRRAQEIFAYLVCSGAQGASRVRLTDLFWPDSDADAAHDNLRVTITSIRKAVGDVIRYESNAYRFEPPPGTRIDTDAFDAHIDKARQAEASGSADAARAHYQAAAELYRGDFLEGMQEGGWQWRERERLRAACIEALRWLAADRQRAEDARGQRLIVDRLLEIAPFDLDAVKARLDALCRESRVGEARRDYDAWRARYRSAVGADAPQIWSPPEVATLHSQHSR